MRQRSGMTFLEYAVLIIVVAAALLAMHAYLKRAVQGKWKASVDSFGFGRQY